MIDTIVRFLSDLKTGMAAAITMIWAPLADAAGYLPGDSSELAFLIGSCLSIVLIVLNVVNIKKAKLEIAIMKRKEAERVAEIRLRKQHGDPLSRKDDEIQL